MILVYIYKSLIYKHNINHRYKYALNNFFLENTFTISIILFHVEIKMNIIGTDIPDPLSPLLPIVHHFWQVFRATSRILT